MPEKWTGALVGKMHNEKITYDEVAAEMGVTKAYISMLLNGHRSPPGNRQRMEAAVSNIIAKRRANTPPSERKEA